MACLPCNGTAAQAGTWHADGALDEHRQETRISARPTSGRDAVADAVLSEGVVSRGGQSEYGSRVDALVKKCYCLGHWFLLARWAA